MNISVDQPLSRRQQFVRNLKHFFIYPKSRAIGLVFASFSIQFGSWATHIPYVKEKLGLNDAQLGLTLFALPAGLVLMNPFTSLIITRFSAPLVTAVSVLLYCFCIVTPIVAPNVFLLVLGLFLTGVCQALLNVAMNTCATALEKHDQITIMSTCHGMWSLGGLVGAGLSSVLMSLGVTPQAHMLGLAALVITLNFWQRPIIMSVPFVRPEPASSLFAWPNQTLLKMIFIGLTIGVGEGVAFDWSAIYMKETVQTSAQVAALAFAGFSLTMTLGRFTGDTIIPRFGGNAILVASCLTGAAGLALAILVPFAPTAILGFTLLGAGCALGVPILYGASSRIPGMAPGAGLATYATFSFLGFLAAPPLIGLISKQVSLSFGLAIVGLLLLASTFLARKVKLQ